jgi:DNA (cytosine-5)-methyltransferase 1
MTELTCLEFFAGGGMARAGLGESWRCLFANDFDRMKVETYEANWGVGDVKHKDVAALTLSDLPTEVVDLVWASFPCQDLSLAGSYRGLGRERDKITTRSGTFWPFWKLIRSLAQDGRAPRAIVLENVYGCLTSHEGRDFAAIASALTELDYRFGAAVIDAVHFVPQSRPRVLFIAFRGDQSIPTSLIGEGPQASWHPPVLIEGLRRYHGDGEAKLDLVEHLAAIGAQLHLRRPHRRGADCSEVARRRAYELHFEPHVSA